MDEKLRTFQVVIKGHLKLDWHDWLDEADISHMRTNHGEYVTRLMVGVVDQSALLGILMRLHSLNLELLQISWVGMGNLVEMEDKQ